MEEMVLGIAIILIGIGIALVHIANELAGIRKAIERMGK